MPSDLLTANSIFKYTVTNVHLTEYSATDFLHVSSKVYCTAMKMQYKHVKVVTQYNNSLHETVI